MPWLPTKIWWPRQRRSTSGEGNNVLDAGGNDGDHQTVEDLTSIIIDIMDRHEDFRELDIHERHDYW